MMPFLTTVYLVKLIYKLPRMLLITIQFSDLNFLKYGTPCKKHSDRVLDLRPRDSRFEPHRRHCIVSLSKNINPSLVLVQPRKTCPFITERLLMGHKESNQTNKHLPVKVKSIVIHINHIEEPVSRYISYRGISVSSQP